jgi:hypothetical protein
MHTMRRWVSIPNARIDLTFCEESGERRNARISAHLRLQLAELRPQLRVFFIAGKKACEGSEMNIPRTSHLSGALNKASKPAGPE